MFATGIVSFRFGSVKQNIECGTDSMTKWLKSFINLIAEMNTTVNGIDRYKRCARILVSIVVWKSEHKTVTNLELFLIFLFFYVQKLYSLTCIRLPMNTMQCIEWISKQINRLIYFLFFSKLFPQCIHIWLIIIELFCVPQKAPSSCIFQILL